MRRAKRRWCRGRGRPRDGMWMWFNGPIVANQILPGLFADSRHLRPLIYLIHSSDTGYSKLAVSVKSIALCNGSRKF
ncbi:hypothetical protein NITHO_20007 [Nitrolancea hollandica Lb]|uniref:Uncharacterized protein n=1 Tax=Nitrolancea hollandica Lb TaxID=1129897 RepID=I4EER6_9BACT|nr:hypothetical protein NITHO_20007 [Nitrolancea hollandica Lb]